MVLVIVLFFPVEHGVLKIADFRTVICAMHCTLNLTCHVEESKSFSVILRARLDSFFS